MASPPTISAQPLGGVAVFGDSLGHEAAPFLAMELAEVGNVTVQTYPPDRAV